MSRTRGRSMAATTCQATGFDEPQDDTMENTQSLHAPDPVQRPVVADEAHSTHRILAMSIWTLATEKLILAAFFRVLKTCSPRFSAFFPCLHSMTVVRDMTKPVREGPGLVSHLLVPPFPIVVILTICTSLYSTL